MSPDSLAADIAAILAEIRHARPRVQCLTNTVAQQITANVLLAAGARVSMATHPAEVVDMSVSADALLINLGTIDEARLTAIPRLIAEPRLTAKPRVLDPVFVEYSPVRLRLAQQVIAAGSLIVKGNASELAALDLPSHAVRAETGTTDRIRSADGSTIAITNGHPWMALVTGLGCALGGLMAACAAVETDLAGAAAAATLTFGIAGELAAERARGPGSFAVAFIDAVAEVDAAKIVARGRITHML